LEQGTGRCEAYTKTFNTLVKGLDLGKDFIYHRYIDGLNKSLVDKVYNTTPTPKTVQEWQTKALELDLNWQRRRKEKEAATKYEKEHTKIVEKIVYRDVPQTRKDPNAMEIDAINSSSATSSGTCFACKKPGHRMDTCKEATCGNCDAKGHIWSNCPKKLVCKICKKEGHAKSRCPDKPNYSRNIRATTTATITEEQDF
jgi:hypothetical protein